MPTERWTRGDAPGQPGQPSRQVSVQPQRECLPIKGGGWELTGRVLAGSPPHPQGTQEKGAEEHGNADEQQVQQALRNHAHDTQHDRHDHQQQKKGNHLRSGRRSEGESLPAAALGMPPTS